jgi:hypothetical protein
MNDEEYNMICTGYQKYTSVHTNNLILGELPNVLPDEVTTLCDKVCQ